MSWGFRQQRDMASDVEGVLKGLVGPDGQPVFKTVVSWWGQDRKVFLEYLRAQIVPPAAVVGFGEFDLDDETAHMRKGVIGITIVGGMESKRPGARLVVEMAEQVLDAFSPKESAMNQHVTLAKVEYWPVSMDPVPVVEGREVYGVMLESIDSRRPEGQRLVG